MNGWINSKKGELLWSVMSSNNVDGMMELESHHLVTIIVIMI